ncbi:RNA demethylase ALKBH9B [Salvia miltiorrhiza]|uniref:RNA demethylase ALKBH9B n=1 Tax=Salvia miltiorrhiza TaxID=226208 RepID=UPI0025AD1AF0|nr:RNA demethylase ALKBH9B [Salvia miltiorrhiza]XP_057784043.1 RNA demethylase ALKBH9B [Salvia miltiorrhiza]
MTSHAKAQNTDPFLLNYDDNEVRIAAEFLSNWLPFLARGLCKSCTQTISDSIRSLHTERDAAVSTPSILDVNHCKEDSGNCSARSTGSAKDSADNYDDDDTHSLGSWKDEADQLSEQAVEASSTSEALNSSARIASPRLKKSWADMAMEDELAAEEDNDVSNGLVDANDSFLEGTSVAEAKPKVALSRDQREYIRFYGVQRKKDFICLERINGKLVNILDGLELHKAIFSAAEQKRIVNYVEQLEEMGRNGQLKARTYTAPQKWMRGKGRITLQFGCCYNYATDKKGNPPGILKAEIVDPLPQLFKVMIKRLVRWHVLPPSCVPDSCIVNIYEEGDCIPPHIDNHEFVRPFCTVSFLSECDILFGSNLKIAGPGEFEGSFAIPLPLGSVLVLTGNGADVAKHCIPAVPSKRISITFRRMDETKRPIGYTPEPDLQGLQPLPDEEERSSKYSASRHRRVSKRPVDGREARTDRGRGLASEYPNPRYSGRTRQGPPNRRRFQSNLEN